MSWQCQGWAFQQTETRTTSQTLMLIYLAARHNIDTNSAFVSYKRMAQDLNIAERTAKRIKAQLVDLGLISVIGSDNPCNTYYIHWTQAVAKNPDLEGDKVTPRAAQGGDRVTPPPCQGDTPGGDRVTPISPLVSPINHQGGERARAPAREISSASSPPEGTTTQATAWRENWTELPNLWADYATQKNLPVMLTFEEFREYYLASSKRWRNWRCVWQRWCRKAAEDAAKKASRGRPVTVSPKLDGSGARPGESWEDYARRVSDMRDQTRSVDMIGGG